MRRGYSREAYLDLVAHIRDVIPNVQFSGDMVRLYIIVTVCAGFGTRIIG